MTPSDAAQPAAVYVATALLKPWAKNPRKNDPAVQAVADSIKRFGFGAPLLVRKATGEIIAGHTRLKAAVKLGLTEVPVRYLDLSESEAHALALADNRVGEIAEWDDEALAAVLRELEGEDVSLDGLGWTGDELEAMIADVELPGDGDEVPPAEEVAVSRAGEVYELGPHRLACGDSTSPEVWAALLGGQKVRMVWTDPPYGVAYVGKTKDALTIENDNLDNDGLATFLRAVFAATMAHCPGGAAWYVAAPPGPRGVSFAVELLAIGVFRQRLVWVKDRFALGHSDYHYRHEDIYYGFVPGDGRRGRGGVGWFGDNAQDTVFEIPRPSASKEHPTMKPVALVQRCIENSSQPGWLVADPFGGSGTTLIAAACSGRVARLIELSPSYCDVIRRRWTRWAKENGQDPGPGALDG